MRKRFAILFGFLGLGLLDSWLSYAFPINFQYTGFSVLWHWFFIGMMVFGRDKPHFTRVLIAAVAGISYDMLFGNSFPFYLCFYTVSGYILGLINPWIQSPKKQFAAYMVFCLAMDMVPFFWQKSQGLLDVSLWKFLFRMELITVFTNSASIVLVMYIDTVMVRFFLIQQHLERKRQKKKMRKVGLQSRNTEFADSTRPARR